MSLTNEPIDPDRRCIGVQFIYDRPGFTVVPEYETPNPFEDIVFFLGIEEMFTCIPLASQRNHFERWPSVAMYCTCIPVCHDVSIKCRSHPHYWFNAYYHCVVIADTGDTYRLL